MPTVRRGQVSSEMWHEARRQERKIRGLMVDYKKRAERRREYYHKLLSSQNPTQYLRIYGRGQKIHLDPTVALAAEAPHCQMPWQGDTDNMIDRFDVRANLDFIPKPRKQDSDSESDDEDKKCNYERYRTLVQNECAGLSEEACLKQIEIEEQFGSSDSTKSVEETKKRLAEKKAAIGFVYEDAGEAATSSKPDQEDGSDAESELSVSEMDLDVVIDIDDLTDEQRELMNQCGTQFGMDPNDMMHQLALDKEEAELLKQAKQAEEEKAQFTGRKSRRERRAIKDKLLQNKKLSPPSYAARDSPKYEEYKRASSSRSRSRSPEYPAPAKFITSFGGDSSGEEKFIGPELPPNLAHSELRSSKSEKSEKLAGSLSGLVRSLRRGARSPKSKSVSRSRSRDRRRSRSRSRRRSRSKRRSWSRSRSRSRRYRSRSRSRRSRSRSSWSRSRRSRSRRSRSRSRSRSYDRRKRRRYSGSRSRSRSRSRRRSRSRSRRPSRSRSRQTRSRSWSRHSRQNVATKFGKINLTLTLSRSNGGATSPGKSAQTTDPSQQQQQQKQPPVRRYRRAELSSGNEMTDSDDEPVKSRTGKQQALSRPVKQDRASKLPGIKAGGDAGTKLTPQEKLRRRMQAALNKQYKQDKKAESEKKEKLEQAQLDREEEMRAIAAQMRKRERERKYREHEEQEALLKSERGRRSRSRSESRSTASSPRRRSRSPPPASRRSPPRSSSPPPPRRRSPPGRRTPPRNGGYRRRQSRSRSKSPPSKSRLVDY